MSVPLRVLLLFLGVAIYSSRADVPATGRFDLTSPWQVLFRSQWLQERRHILQSFAFDDVNGYLYVVQVEGSDAAGTFAEHGGRGDLVLTKLTSDGKRIVGHMNLRGFGHGVSIGVEPDGAAVYLWTEVDATWNPEGQARGHRLGRFKFVDGETLAAHSTVIEKFTPVPGAAVCTPSVDLLHGRIAMRYVNTEGKWHVALYDLAEFKTGSFKPIADLPLPFDFGTVQGWTTYGSWLYVYSGNAYSDDNPPDGNAMLFAVDWNTGKIVQRSRTTAYSELNYREPEGLAVQNAKGGPRLCFGFGASVSATDARRTVSIACLTGLISSLSHGIDAE